MGNLFAQNWQNKVLQGGNVLIHPVNPVFQIQGVLSQESNAVCRDPWSETHREGTQFSPCIHSHMHHSHSHTTGRPQTETGGHVGKEMVTIQDGDARNTKNVHEYIPTRTHSHPLLNNAFIPDPISPRKSLLLGLRWPLPH